MEGGGNIFDIEAHPLLNDVVLNVLFEYLKVEELKKCRAVCSLWNSSVLASRSWKRWTKMCFDDERGLTVESFLTLVENRIGSCFSETFEIYDRQDMYNTRISYFLIPQPFWLRCGVWIKILKLREVKFESVDDFRRVIYEACPNMEQLILHYIEVTRSEKKEDELALEPTDYLEPQFGEHKNMRVLSIKEFRKSYGVSWMELLSHFPNLKALRLDWHIPNIAGLLTSFIKIREKFPKKLELKHITCISPPPQFFSILKDPGLQLQTVETDVFPDEDDLREILTMHASSLKKLSLLDNDYIQEHYPLKIFPLWSTKFRSIGLDALQVLELHNDVFDSMAILKFTPNLRVLKIEASDDTVIVNTQLSEMRDVSLQKCRKLGLVIPEALSLESLSRLINWIPNVEELIFEELNNPQFQMICESWPALVTLVGFGTADDIGITGLDEEDVRRINEQEENSSWRPITVPRANIAALKGKGLRNLTMSSGESMTDIGYCAAVYGVEQLQKLERLHFDEYKFKGRIWDSLHSRFPKAEFQLDILEDYTSRWDFRLRRASTH